MILKDAHASRHMTTNPFEQNLQSNSHPFLRIVLVVRHFELVLQFTDLKLKSGADRDCGVEFVLHLNIITQLSSHSIFPNVKSDSHRYFAASSTQFLSLWAQYFSLTL